MTPAELEPLVLLGGALLGALFGAVASAIRFCTMGAIADVVNFGDADRLRLWVWTALVAMLGTQGLQQLGGVDLSGALPLQPRLPLLSLVLGGAAFGFGMVLASGCPSRALVLAGHGNLKSLLVLVGVGLAAQMTLRGVLAAPRVHGPDALALTLAGPQDIASALARAGGVPLGAARALVVLAIALPVLAWVWREPRFRRPAPWLGGLAIGACIAGAWWLTGRFGFIAEHPETLEPAWLGTHSHRPEAFSFVAPSAHLLDLLTLWSDSGTRLSFGVALLLGVLAGSFGIGLLRGELRLEGFADAHDLARHAVGALLMGAGGVTALGCSIGQGLSGVSTLAIGSFVAVAAMAAGAVAALRYLANVG